MDYWDNNDYNDNYNNDNNDNDNNIYDHHKYDNYNNTDGYGYEDNSFTLLIFFIVLIWSSMGLCRFINYCQNHYRYHNNNNNNQRNQRLITNNNNQSEIDIEDIEKTLIKYNDEEHTEKTCSICLDEYLNNDELFKLMCNHYYHKKCIIDWLTNNSSCPLCRINLL